MIAVFVFPTPPYVACSECGACVLRSGLDDHICDRERWLDYQLVRLRPLTARFEVDFTFWLLGPHGRFETYYAETRRR